MPELSEMDTKSKTSSSNKKGKKSSAKKIMSILKGLEKEILDKGDME